MTRRRSLQRPSGHVLAETTERRFRSMLPPDWVFRPLSPDYGVDAEIEIVRDGQLTGLTFGVQFKGRSTVSQDRSSMGPVFPCDLPLLQTAESWERPLILVLYDAGRETVHWLWLQQHIATVLDLTVADWRARDRLPLRFDPDDRLPPEDPGWRLWAHIAGHPRRNKERLSLLATLQDIESFRAYIPVTLATPDFEWSARVMTALLGAKEKLEEVLTLRSLFEDVLTFEADFECNNLRPLRTLIYRSGMRLVSFRAHLEVDLLTAAELNAFCPLYPVDDVYDPVPISVEFSVVLHNLIDSLTLLRRAVSFRFNSKRLLTEVERTSLRPYGNNFAPMPAEYHPRSWMV